MDNTLLFLLKSMVNLDWPGKKIKIDYRPAKLEPDPQKILLVQLSSIGDVCWTLPCLPGLRDKFKESKIYFLVEETAQDLVTGSRFLDGTIVFPRESLLKDLDEAGKDLVRIEEELRGFIGRLKEERFDLIVNLHTSPRSAILTYLAQAKNIQGLWTREDGHPVISGSLWFLHRYLLRGPLSTGRLLNEVELNMKMLGLNPSPLKRQAEISIPEETRKSIDKLLKRFKIGDDDLLIGLNPGSNSKARQWPKMSFAKLADELIKKYKAKILIFGGPDDVDLAREIEKQITHLHLRGASFINLAGRTTLKELVCLAGRCDHFITNDTGPMHIAGIAGTKVLAINGPTPFAPHGGGGHLRIQANLPGINCGGTTTCTKGDCMKAIEVEDVLAAIQGSGIRRPANAGTPGSGRINIYASGNELPNRLFDYAPLKKKPLTEEGLVCEILKVGQLNAISLINEELGYQEDFFTPEESFESLRRIYEIEKIGGKIDRTVEEIRQYQDLCREGLLRIKTVSGHLQREEAAKAKDSFSLFIKEVDNPLMSKQGKLPAKVFSFINFLFPPSSNFIPDLTDRFLKIYEADLRASSDIIRFLGEYHEFLKSSL
ncbi:glycosyltransferase family 9 protein [bacterium]|nr:glycosyltransferase family 9 protein [bacterium]